MVLSQEELEVFKHIKIFPNPANNKITITSDKKQITSISILNIQGKEIRIIQINSLKEELDISFLEKGIYLLRIETKKGVVVKKIIKN